MTEKSSTTTPAEPEVDEAAVAARKDFADEAEAAGVSLRGSGKDEQAQAAIQAADDGLTPHQRRIKKALEIVRTRNRAVKQRYSTSRDIFTGRVDQWSGPEEVMANIVVTFHSDQLMERAGAISGFLRDIWEPVTQKEIEAFQLRFNTKERRGNGQPCYGKSMAAYWTTKEAMNRQNAVNRGNRSYTNFDDMQQQLEEGLADGTYVIGKTGRESSSDIPSSKEFFDRISDSDAVEAEYDEMGDPSFGNE